MDWYDVKGRASDGQTWSVRVKAENSGKAIGKARPKLARHFGGNDWTVINVKRAY